MKKKRKIVMLTTEKATENTVCINQLNKNLFIASRSIHGNKLFEVPFHGQHEKGITPQHLYVLSDEKIKEGDWCFRKGNGSHIKSFVFKASKKWLIENEESLDYILPTFLKTNCKKIIATTDESLLLLGEFSTTSGNVGYHPKPLPQLSNDFIKEYCERGGVDEIKVKYRQDYDLVAGDTGEYPVFFDVVKINFNNTIDASFIKKEEKLYTKEEIRKAYNAGHLECLRDWSETEGVKIKSYDDYHYDEDFPELYNADELPREVWIKENLK